ncbi:hypothetical protein NUU61_008781 [Penicillium alfredii]|uniref:Uncharacterized protein n=1 Tax=Penicillium alfredii TaxID=1506179 RepID=A0A9W9ELV3_9EURO|nr:uncharacterized protein NUU61_008781 [Penicillium alfredii]KAJ5084202.1 hypothetical protein NUU61_008781 [Penicillium alfredii]
MASVTCHGDPDMALSPADNLLSHPPCIDLSSPSKTPCNSVTEITEKCVIPVESPPTVPVRSSEMDTPKMKRVDPPSTKTPDSSPTSPSRPRPASRPTSGANSVNHSRSASRNTARSRPTSRRSSLHSARRVIPNTAIVPVHSARSTPQEKRESLLALHRESCRLFQDQSSRSDAENPKSLPTLHTSASSTYRSRREGRASSETARELFQRTPFPLRPSDRANTDPPPMVGTASNYHRRSPSSSSVHVPATVMEWTSVSTRRREYEKIDRASRGVRGLWRRVAPRWCRTRDARTPFFEEGRPSREGSVRRFRMDLPGDGDQTREARDPGKPQVQLLDFLHRGPGNESESGSQRRWPGLRSRTS